MKRLSDFPNPPCKQQHRCLDKTPPSCTSSHSVTTSGASSTDERKLMSVSIGKPLISDYGVHELPDYDGGRDALVDIALTARIEMLESEVHHLKDDNHMKTRFFQLEKIAQSDSLIRFYTGFTSYEIMLAFYEYLGPAVHKLRYWGESDRKTSRQMKNPKLDLLNQLF